jgi:Leucine-rich repeat (LRR) protein
MNKIQTCVGAFFIAACACFSSCDNDKAKYSSQPIANTELKAILLSKGYQFNEQGNLLLDDLAMNTLKLDLSGTNLTDFAGLDQLPNLTEVDLSDNGYKMSFDFSALPQQITAVDLTGNELYEFPGLLDIQTQENGDETVTVLHNLTKLYLPESAKYNCNEIPTFFAKVQGADLKMEKAGTLTAYNTLRDVPDEGFRATLKKTFPSMFNGEQIDISKRLVASNEVTQSITTVNMDARTEVVDNVDGFQYILGNKGYMGGFIYMAAKETCTVSYFPVNSNGAKLILKRISTPNGIDLSRAMNLYYLETSYNPTIETIDFSISTALGQRGDGSGDTFLFLSCDKLKTVSFPAAAKVLTILEFTNCPSLEKVDLSQFETMSMLRLGLLPASCKVIYLAPIRLYRETSKLAFGIDEAMYNRPETKAFLDTYHTQCGIAGFSSGHGAKLYNWMANY